MASLAIALAHCGGLRGQPPERPPSVRAPDGQVYYLVERGPYKAYYDGGGRLDHMEFDKPGDAERPERIIVRYHGQKRPRRLEIDVDRDGHFDRWEDYDAEGRLTRAAFTDADGKARRWTVPGPNGEPLRYEYDEGGDGRAERVEIIEGGRIARVELDTDGDGKIDRWQEWTGAHLVREAIDTDGDTKADRRLVYAGGGQLERVERVNP
jgi:YD repeat-containing protein